MCGNDVMNFQISTFQRDRLLRVLDVIADGVVASKAG